MTHQTDKPMVNRLRRLVPATMVAAALGLVAGSALAASGSAHADDTSAAATTVRVTAESMIRSGPGTGFAATGSAPVGATFRALCTTGATGTPWVAVEAVPGMAQGYLPANQLDVNPATLGACTANPFKQPQTKTTKKKDSKTSPILFPAVPQPGSGTTSQDDKNAQGRACIFYAPGTWFGIEAGHVGWAVGDPATGRWVLGSADGGNDSNPSLSKASGTTSSVSGSSGGESNTSSAQSSNSDPARSSTGSSGSSTAGLPGTAPTDPGVPQYAPNDPRKVWVTRSTSLANVVRDFDSFGWYSSYRCKQVDGHVETAYAFAIQDGNFNLIYNNCMHHAWRALDAYKPGMLAPAPLMPSTWFANLGTTDGFDAPQAMPHPASSSGGKQSS